MITILRPSSADLWTNCAAQPQMVERLAPEESPSDPAMEGTCAAWLAEQVLTGQADKCIDLVDTVCPENNWPIDHVMANDIQRYVDMIVERGGEIHAERKVRLNEFIEGTPDAYAVMNEQIYAGSNYTARQLYVDDLKYGFGIVEPTSKQVAIYSAAIAITLHKHGSTPDLIQIGIYQPRGYHTDGIYRHRTVTFDELMIEANDIIEAGKKCFDPNALATPGEHCKYCPAAGSCNALSTELYAIYTMLSGKSNRNITGDELAAELRFLVLLEDMMKGRKTAITAETHARMDNGEYVPGWDRQQGYGNRRWKVSSDTVHALTGVDPTDGRMVTPAAMEKKGVNIDLLKHMTEKPRTKAKLVPFNGADIARQFGK